MKLYGNHGTQGHMTHHLYCGVQLSSRPHAPPTRLKPSTPVTTQTALPLYNPPSSPTSHSAHMTDEQG